MFDLSLIFSDHTTWQLKLAINKCQHIHISLSRIAVLPKYSLNGNTSPHEFLITGDFNIHVDDLTDSNAIQFLSLLDHSNLTQHVLLPTHRHSHTLDLVITFANSTLSPTVTSLPISPTDQFPIIIMFIEDY